MKQQRDKNLQKFFELLIWWYSKVFGRRDLNLVFPVKLLKESNIPASYIFVLPIDKVKGNDIDRAYFIAQKLIKSSKNQTLNSKH